MSPLPCWRQVTISGGWPRPLKEWSIIAGINCFSELYFFLSLQRKVRQTLKGYLALSRLKLAPALTNKDNKVDILAGTRQYSYHLTFLDTMQYEMPQVTCHLHTGIHRNMPMGVSTPEKSDLLQCTGLDTAAGFKISLLHSGVLKMSGRFARIINSGKTLNLTEGKGETHLDALFSFSWHLLSLQF